MIASLIEEKEPYMNVIDRLLTGIKAFNVDAPTRPCSMTIKDFSGLKDACKVEIMLEGKDAIVTHITGDVESVFGWKRHDLVGNDLLKLFKVDKKISEKAFKDLLRNGWAFKQNTFKGSNGKDYHTCSILLWREVGKSVVELIFKQ